MIKLPEEKQILIEKCQKDIAQMQSWRDGDDYSQDIKIYEIALETLTAKPVEWQLQCWDDTVPEENRWFDCERYKHKVTALKNQRVVEYYTHPPVQVFRPVQLPDISAGKYYTEEGTFMAFDYKRDLVTAIRAAGGEVKND